MDTWSPCSLFTFPLLDLFLSALSLSFFRSFPSPLKGKQLAAMDEVVRDASLHYVLPRTSLTPLLSSGMLSPREVSAHAILQGQCSANDVYQVAYGYAAWKFAFHFLNRCLDEYRDISNLLRGTADEKALQKLVSC